MFDIDFRFFLIISAGYTASDHQLSICLLKRQLKETWHISGMSVTPIQIRLVFRINFIYGHAEFGKLLLAKHILVSRKLAKKKHFWRLFLIGQIAQPDQASSSKTASFIWTMN